MNGRRLNCSLDDEEIRFMVRTTRRRLEVVDAVAEMNHIDRHSLVNHLLSMWVLNNVDEDYKQQIGIIFNC